MDLRAPVPVDGLIVEPEPPETVVISSRPHYRRGSPGGVRWRILPKGVIYRSYMSGQKESKFRSVWNQEKDADTVWDVTLGGQVSMLRFGTGGDERPQGFELGIEGSGQVRLDPDENRDVDAVDFRFGIPFAWGNERQQIKFGYYHLSSHLGDEFLLKTPGFTRLDFVRDVLILGYSYYVTPQLRLYGEAGWAFNSIISEPWEFQFGVDYGPAGPTGLWGAPFAAVSGHIREELDFGGTFVAQTGWAWRGSASSGTFRMGAQYFNGGSDQYSFFDEHEEKIGLGLWYDY